MIITSAFSLSMARKNINRRRLPPLSLLQKYSHRFSGHTDTIEVAVRRAVATGVNQACGKAQEQLADDLGCDLVETTAHSGARPEHALWQGQIFSRSGKSTKYPDFRRSTGYGTGAGLMGWNCRHSFNPWFEGSPRT